MDKVFVSNGRKGRNGNWKNKIRGFGMGREKDANNDVLTEYFPYAGGDGVDEFAYSTSSMSYSPVDVMQESTIQLEQPMGLGRHVRRILVRGSKYDVYDSRSLTPPVSPKCTEINEIHTENPKHADLSYFPHYENEAKFLPPNSFLSNHQQLVAATDESFGRSNLNKSHSKFSGALKRLSEPVYRKPVPSGPSELVSPNIHEIDGEEALPLTPVTDMLTELLKFEWAEAVPTSFPKFVQSVRSASRASRVLAPLDAYVDGFRAQLPGSELLIVGVELFSLMAVTHYVAKVISVICFPAVLLIKLSRNAF